MAISLLIIVLQLFDNSNFIRISTNQMGNLSTIIFGISASVLSLMGLIAIFVSINSQHKIQKIREIHWDMLSNRVKYDDHFQRSNFLLDSLWLYGNIIKTDNEDFVSKIIYGGRLSIIIICMIWSIFIPLIGNNGVDAFMLWLAFISAVVILLFFHNVLDKLNNLIEIGKLFPIEDLMDANKSNIELPTILAANLQVGCTRQFNLHEYDDQEDRYVEIVTENYEGFIITEEVYNSLQNEIDLSEIDVLEERLTETKEEIESRLLDLKEILEELKYTEVKYAYYLFENEYLNINFSCPIPIRNYTVELVSLSVLYRNKNNKEIYNGLLPSKRTSTGLQRYELVTNKVAKDAFHTSINNWIQNNSKQQVKNQIKFRISNKRKDIVIISVKEDSEWIIPSTSKAITIEAYIRPIKQNNQINNMVKVQWLIDPSINPYKPKHAQMIISKINGIDKISFRELSEDELKLEERINSVKGRK